MEPRKGRAKIRSEPLPPSSPSFAISASRHRYKLPICSKWGIFPGACGEVATLLLSLFLQDPSRVKEVNTRGASSVHRIVSLASCVRPINLPVLSSSSSPPCTRNRARFVRAVYAAAPTSDKSAADTINESYYGASKTTY